MPNRAIPRSGLLATIEDLTLQFGYKTTKDGVPVLTAGGLSALEGAFYVLGWEDPHPYPEGACAVADCNAWATCIGPIPGGDGTFGQLCFPHFAEASHA